MLACYFENRSCCLLFYVCMFLLLCAHSLFHLLSVMLWEILVHIVLLIIKSSSREWGVFTFTQWRHISSVFRTFFSLSRLDNDIGLNAYVPRLSCVVTSYREIWMKTVNSNTYLCLCSSWIDIGLHRVSQGHIKVFISSLIDIGPHVCTKILFREKHILYNQADFF